MSITEAGAKAKEKIFRLKPEEDARLPRLIEYAYRTGYIAKQSFQDYMMFALNRLKDEYERGREGDNQKDKYEEGKTGISPAKPPCFTVNCDE